ncbi:S8 family serine peptidase [Actinomadura yumaensis]|uniref:S8 family serine peptidase n=1 Tax=Actinomadura yumaensis TaxID=111807 RepID=UPI003620E2BA
MSLGGGRLFYDGSRTEESAIRYALSKGVVLIASAGNDGSSANRKNFPAAYSGVIAVGALDRRLKLWKDSNRRPYVAVCAPGVEIVSADNGNGYVVGTGTSPASAMVAGVAALIRSRYQRLTPDEVRQALVQGAPARAGQPTGSDTCKGPLDAVRALAAAAKINKAAHGPGATAPKPAAASPAPEAAPEDGSHTLLIAVLGGGGVLVLVGLVLGWLQRRRPEEDDDYAPVHDGSGDPAASHGSAAPAYAPAPGEPREQVSAVAPVNAPLWQSTEVTPPGSGFAPSHQAARPPATDDSPLVPSVGTNGASGTDSTAGMNGMAGMNGTAGMDAMDAMDASAFPNGKHYRPTPTSDPVASNGFVPGRSAAPGDFREDAAPTPAPADAAQGESGSNGSSSDNRVGAHRAPEPAPFDVFNPDNGLETYAEPQPPPNGTPTPSTATATAPPARTAPARTARTPRTALARTPRTARTAAGTRSAKGKCWTGAAD